MNFKRHRQQGAFTLIEVMLVTGIVLLMLGWGVPNMLRALEKHGIAKATMDIMDGCKQARALAILKGTVAELVINTDNDSYALYVRQAVNPRLLGPENPGLPEDMLNPDPISGNNSRKSRTHFEELDGFRRTLEYNIALEEIWVNFVDLIDEGAGEARIRFFPNGTSDEFMVTVLLNDDRRIIMLDPITGLPSLSDPKHMSY